jgi:REP element-mobilizing transposase RayT
MAGKLRFDQAGAIHHAYARGNGRKDIFKSDKDRQAFLHYLSKAAERYEWRIYSYCLMDNHYHLAIKTLEATLSKGMHWLNSMYSHKFNYFHDDVGHRFQGRFKNTLVQSGEHLSVLNRYIVLNPERAKIVSDPIEWQWSSFRATLGLTKPENFLDVEGALADFGENLASARNNYREFVLSAVGKKPDDIYKPILGNRDFIEQNVSHLNDQQKLIFLRPELREIFNENQIDFLTKKQRDERIREAVQTYGYKQNEVARFIGMSPVQICKINQGV